MQYKQFELVKQGLPGQFQFSQKALTDPGPGEVSIKVAFCGLNHLDLWLEKGMLPIQVPLPRVPGGEISGTIHAVGSGVNSLVHGQKVVVQSNLFCGHCEYCQEGNVSQCLESQLMGVQVDGGLAEYVTVPARAVLPVPKNLDLDAAASIVLAGSTAMHMVTNRTKISPGDWVLAMGGNSGVGSYAIQIAQELGARVIASASTEEKAEFAKKLGAEYVVNHRIPGWSKDVRKHTNKKGVDLIVEHIGGKILEESFRCLARGGTIVTCGATAGKDIQIDLWPFFVKEQKLVGSYGRTTQDLITTLDWVAQKKIKPAIHQVFPLSQAHEAFDCLRSGRALGKILVSPE